MSVESRAIFVILIFSKAEINALQDSQLCLFFKDMKKGMNMSDKWSLGSVGCTTVH